MSEPQLHCISLRVYQPLEGGSCAAFIPGGEAVCKAPRLGTTAYIPPPPNGR